MAKRVAVYSGTFDPITKGHLDIICRALNLFDHVIIAVADNLEKQTLFSKDERLQMVRLATRDMEGVTVDSFKGLLAHYVQEKGVAVIVRGLRAVSDLEHEFRMAFMNRSLVPQVETLFLMPSEDFTYLNSTVVKEVARLGGDVSQFVPPVVEERLRSKLKNST
ncbi:MAG: phosphopantetheine adenylyltransferase [candidate division Zixibacteria bacterium SM23_81]|nr:MAG: phosphopantetheine adenylyltransferase [candidate division Zixibacteria bacterium SM23_81]